MEQVMSLDYKRIDNYLRSLGETSLEFYVIEITNEQDETIVLYMNTNDEYDILEELRMNYDYFIVDSSFVDVFWKRMCYCTADVETEDAEDADIEVFSKIYDTGSYGDLFEELSSDYMSICVEE